METVVIEKTQTQVVVDLPKFNKIKAVVLLDKGKGFKNVEKPYDLQILGRSMLDWVKIAVEDYTTVVVDNDNEKDVVEIVAPLVGDEDYLLVLYSDTPLLRKNTIKDVVDYVTTKEVDVCKLTRGYVFKADFLKKTNNTYTAEPRYFDEEDFITAFDFKQLALVEEILRNRILNFHMKNGVRILDTTSVRIDTDVSIMPGVVIHQNNCLYGVCYIGENVVLKPNNVITSSVIGKGSEIVSSVVTSVKVPENSKIGPFAYIS